MGLPEAAGQRLRLAAQQEMSENALIGRWGNKRDVVKRRSSETNATLRPLLLRALPRHVQRPAPSRGARRVRGRLYGPLHQLGPVKDPDELIIHEDLNLVAVKGYGTL